MKGRLKGFRRPKSLLIYSKGDIVCAGHAYDYAALGRCGGCSKFCAMQNSTV